MLHMKGFNYNWPSICDQETHNENELEVAKHLGDLIGAQIKISLPTAKTGRQFLLSVPATKANQDKSQE